MSRPIPAVPSLIGVGIACCVVAAVFTRPVPLPAPARDAWVGAANGVVRRHAALHTYVIDTVSIGSVDTPYGSGRFVAARGKVVRTSGWAFDPTSRATAKRFLYRIDGAAWHEASYHLARPDVAAALNVPGAADSGFRVDISTAPLRLGVHRIAFATVAENGSPNRLADELVLTITNH